MRRERDSNKEKIEKDRIVIHFLADSWKESVPFPLSLLQRLDGSDDRRAREKKAPENVSYMLV